MNYKLCVWDLDGTLLDSIPALHYCDNRSLLHFGFEPIDYRQSVELIKYPLGQYYQNLLRMGGCPEERVDLLADELTEYNYSLYEKYCTFRIREYEGVKDVIRELNGMGIVNAVLSNKFQEISQSLVDTYYKDEIKIVFGQHPDHPSKPKEGSADRLFDLGFSRKEILIIGDTEVDILTAENNHIDCCAVTWGYQTREHLSSLHPEYLIDKPEQLLELLRR